MKFLSETLDALDATLRILLRTQGAFDGDENAGYDDDENDDDGDGHDGGDDNVVVVDDDDDDVDGDDDGAADDDGDDDDDGAADDGDDDDGAAAEETDDGDDDDDDDDGADDDGDGEDGDDAQEMNGVLSCGQKNTIFLTQFHWNGTTNETCDIKDCSFNAVELRGSNSIDSLKILFYSTAAYGRWT